jgi:K+-transporting ATPase ATPase C chain
MIAIRVTLVLTVLCGLIYPLAITGAARLLFPHESRGSLVVRDGRVIGSELIGRQFDDPRYFWPRLSATPSFPYNAGASSGTNFGSLHPKRKEQSDARRAALQTADPRNAAPIPADLLTASGSGLDPHISPDAADYQATRVARARGISLDRVNELIARHTSLRQLGVLGEPVVNVWLLNLDLDRQ